MKAFATANGPAVPHASAHQAVTEATPTGPETMVVRCRSCSRTFPTPWQVDRATLESMVLTEEYRCPWCDETHTYIKQDHAHQLIAGEGRTGQ